MSKGDRPWTSCLACDRRGIKIGSTDRLESSKHRAHSPAGRLPISQQYPVMRFYANPRSSPVVSGTIHDDDSRTFRYTDTTSAARPMNLCQSIGDALALTSDIVRTYSDQHQLSLEDKRRIWSEQLEFTRTEFEKITPRPAQYVVHRSTGGGANISISMNNVHVAPGARNEIGMSGGTIEFDLSRTAGPRERFLSSKQDLISRVQQVEGSPTKVETEAELTSRLRDAGWDEMDIKIALIGRQVTENLYIARASSAQAGQGSQTASTEPGGEPTPSQQARRGRGFLCCFGEAD